MPLDLPVFKTNTGSGSASDPYVYFLDHEFNQFQFESYDLPEITDNIACYFQSDTRVNGQLGNTNQDLSSTGVYTLVTYIQQDDDPSNQTTSRAFSFDRISIVLTLIGLMSYNL